MRKAYPSDISRETYSEIEEILISGRKRTKTRKINSMDPRLRGDDE